jgi:hypothetical protein
MASATGPRAARTLADLEPTLGRPDGIPETIAFFLRLFRPARSGETILSPTKPFSTFGADVRKQPFGIKLPQRTALAG